MAERTQTTDTGQESVRIDKWLWAARFYKTRALAQAAVAAGKVKLMDERVKAAKEVKVGDELAIRIGEFEWTITVAGISSQRGPATVAQKL